MLASLALALLSPSIEPRRLSFPFSNLIEDATVICIGTVDEVRTVPVAKEAWPSRPDEPVFGHVVIERVLKGPSDLKSLWHEGWASLSEDFTLPGLNVRGLLLLRPGQVERTAPPDAKDQLRRALGPEPILRNVGMGWGLIAIRKSDAGDLLDPHPCYPDAFLATGKDFPERSARLADVVDYIEVLQRFSGDALALHAYSSARNDEASFDLRVLRDGSARLATNVEGRNWKREVVTLEKWEPEVWSATKSALETLLGRKQLKLHRESKLGGTRELRVSLPSAGLDFTNAKLLVDELEGEERATYAVVLRCWSEVRARIAALEIADYSQEDKVWLEKH
jgi:hypothetical protein